MKIKASCGCGQLSFESDSEPVLTLCCHCLDCQDAVQAAFANIAFFSMDKISVQGELAEKHYVAASGGKTRRQFCAHCDTVMFDRSDGFLDLIGVMASQLQPPYSFIPGCHVFVRDKKPGVVIPEDIKRFDMGIS